MSVTTLALRQISIANDTYITKNLIKSDSSLSVSALQKKLDVFDEEDTLEPYFVLKNSGSSSSPNWTVYYSTASGKSGTTYKSGITNGIDALNAAYLGLPSSRSTKLKIRVDSDLYANESSSADSSNTYGSISKNISNLYAVNVQSYSILDFNGNTFYANTKDATTLVPLSIYGKKFVSIRNTKFSGAARYTIWAQGVDNCIFKNITMSMNSSSGLGLRIAYKGSTSSTNIYVDDITASGLQDNAVETYDVNGILIGTITATDCNDCGLLLNKTQNAAVGTVNGTRCSPRSSNGVYAAMRCANYCGTNVHIGTINATECGRGFFSVSANTGITINAVNSTNSYAQAILVQDTQNLTILGGTLTAGSHNKDKAVQISTGSAGGTLANKNNTFKNMTIKNYKYGFYQSSVSTNTTISNITYSGVTTKTSGF